VNLHPAILAGFAVVTTVGLLLLLEIVERHVATDLSSGNAGWRLLRVGQVLGVFLVAAAAVKNCPEGDDLASDALWVGSFAITGLLLLVVTGRLGHRLLLASRLGAELDRGNVAAGIAGGAHYVSTAILTSVALAGHDFRSLGLAVGFFVLAQVTLHVFVALFRALTTYDDAEQIAGENLAAALSYAGLSIAVAIIVARALEGDFVDWTSAMRGYGGVLLGVLALYPVRQLFVQSLLLRGPLTLRGGRLDAGIAVERNAGLAALEAVSYIATALTIARLA
jgi:uncharacterized membrane protein YjfL (UPF0719 family)